MGEQRTKQAADRKRRLNGGGTTPSDTQTLDGSVASRATGRQLVARTPGARATSATPTVVNWSIGDIVSAYEDLTLLLRGNPDGAFGYKASIVRTVLDSLVKNASAEDARLKQQYRKSVPKEGGGEMPLPDVQDGRMLPTSFWCSDPAAYERRAAAARDVVHSITFPVRFTYDEVASHSEPIRDPNTGIVTKWIGIRGSFWRNLMPLIDPPSWLDGADLPQPEPTVSAADGDSSIEDTDQ
jgi:hypothetical protein